MRLRNTPTTELICAECGRTKGVWRIEIGVRAVVLLCTECVQRLNMLTEHDNREKARRVYAVT